jgi:hypothetical protein
MTDLDAKLTDLINKTPIWVILMKNDRDSRYYYGAYATKESAETAMVLCQRQFPDFAFWVEKDWAL